MKIAFHIPTDSDLVPEVSSVIAVYREAVKALCSSDDSK